MRRFLACLAPFVFVAVTWGGCTREVFRESPCTGKSEVECVQIGNCHYLYSAGCGAKPKKLGCVERCETDDDCVDGRSCSERDVNPCYSELPNPSGVVCGTCSSSFMACWPDD